MFNETKMTDFLIIQPYNELIGTHTIGNGSKWKSSNMLQSLAERVITLNTWIIMLLDASEF